MSNTFYYIANCGRSGSTYLFNFLRSLNCQNTHYIAHEDIPIQITKPRHYNRSYDIYELKKCLNDKRLEDYLSYWEESLENRSIVETGWTSYHLLPVLHHLFAPN